MIRNNGKPGRMRRNDGTTIPQPIASPMISVSTTGIPRCYETLYKAELSSQQVTFQYMSKYDIPFSIQKRIHTKFQIFKFNTRTTISSNTYVVFRLQFRHHSSCQTSWNPVFLDVPLFHPLGTADLSVIDKAIDEWRMQTCISFREATDDHNFVQFQDGGG